MPEAEVIETAGAAAATVADPQGSAKEEGTTLSPERNAGDTGEVVVDLKGITQDDDGNLVFKVPGSASVYKGKTLDELMDKVGEGIAHKDTLIAKSVVTKSARKAIDTARITRDDNARGDDGPINIPQPPPKEEVIRKHFNEQLKQARIEPKKLGWTNEQWKDYQHQNGLEAWEIGEEREAVKAVRKSAMEAAEAEYSTATMEYLNAKKVEASVDLIASAIVEDYGIDPEKFDVEEFYLGILEEVSQNEKNYDSAGVLKDGVIVALAHKRLRTLEKPELENRISKKLEDDIARGNGLKAGIKAPPGSSAQHVQKHRVPATSEDALQAATKFLKGKGVL